MAVNRFFPAVVFPTTVARRGVEGVLFLVPAVFQEGLATSGSQPMLAFGRSLMSMLSRSSIDA